MITLDAYNKNLEHYKVVCRRVSDINYLLLLGNYAYLVSCCGDLYEEANKTQIFSYPEIPEEPKLPEFQSFPSEIREARQKFAQNTLEAINDQKFKILRDKFGF